MDGIFQPSLRADLLAKIMGCRLKHPKVARSTFAWVGAARIRTDDGVTGFRHVLRDAATRCYVEGAGPVLCWHVRLRILL